jgi:hypothetical protein
METGTIGLRQVSPAVTMEPVQGSVGHSASSEQRPIGLIAITLQWDFGFYIRGA